MKATSIFKDSHFLNPLIRAILFWSVFILLLYPISSSTNSFFPVQWHNWVFGITGAIVALIATWIFLKYEKKSFASIGLLWEKKTLVRFLRGMLIGTLMIGLILFGLLAFTDLEIAKNNKPISLAALLGYLVYIPLAYFEEITFRSYPFLKLNKAFGLRITQIIVAVIFACYHIIIGWDVQVAFLGPGVWAFVFGLAAVWSGGIAVPLGIHVAINILQNVFGMKQEAYSVWMIQFREGTPGNMEAQAETIGLVIQVVILFGAVLLTEYFIRREKKSTIRK